MSEQLLEQNNEPEEAVERGPSAAEQLRSAREKLGLSREEVATELRLHLKLITALEENDRSQLPPAAFIGGYLRAYAKLLGLPAEQIISEYLDEGVAPSTYRPTDRSGAQVVSSQDPQYRMISVGVVGVLLLLFVLWWANERYAFVGATQQAASEEQTQAPAEEQIVMSPLPAVELRDPPQEEATTALAVPVTSSAKAAAGALPAPVGTNQPTEAPAVAKPSSASASATTTTEPLTIPQQTAVAVSEPLPATTPQAILRLEYQAASWTQVEDAQGRILAYELTNPGRRMELRGVAPFKVFLGYAPGVLVYYNGSLYSHAAYQRGDLAKFSVGTAQDNRPLAR